MSGTQKIQIKRIESPLWKYRIFWHPPPDSNVSSFLERNYLFCSKIRHSDWLEDMSPHGHTEGPVDPFHRIRMASKIKQHLCVVELGWVLLTVSK